MRILMVIGQFRPLIGGAERQCELLARALAARGHTVSVLTVRPERGVPLHETMGGVAIERIPYPIAMIGGRRFGCGFLALPVLWWRAWRMLSTCDVVMAHQALWPAFVACVAAKLRRRPVVVKLGNSGERFDLDVLRQSHWYGTFARRFLLRNVTRFITTSSAVRDDLRHVGVSSERIAEIPNGVILPSPPVERQTCEALRAVFVGTLTPKKNVVTLLEAMVCLSTADRSRIILTIVGDGPERAALERQVQKLGIADHVALYGMIGDPASMLAKSDLFVLPSRTEGLSNAALEAMANGCALLLSDVGGNTDLIPNAKPEAGQPFLCGATGILVDPQSPDAIAAGFRWFLTHPDARRQMGERARAMTEERYTIDRVAVAHETLLRTMTRPRVVHLLTFLDSRGGMERQALQLAHALRASGVPAFFITSAHVNRMRREHLALAGTIEGFRVYRIPFIRRWQRWNAIVYGLGGIALLIMFRRRYDIIHAHQLHTSGVIGSCARRLLRGKRLIVKDCAVADIGDVANLRRLWRGWGIAMLRRASDTCVGVSVAAADEMREIGLPHVLVIPNGVDTERFHPATTAQRIAARAALGISRSHAYVLLFVGRLGPEKNVGVLLDAVAVLGVPFVLIIAGDGMLRAALEAQARAIEIATRTRFLGVVDDVSSLYHAADCFVLPSKSEGMSNVVLEAMACGLPIVSSNIASAREILTHERDGFLIDSTDPKGLAQAISMATVPLERARSMGAAARIRVEQSFALTGIASRYAALYSTLTLSGRRFS